MNTETKGELNGKLNYIWAKMEHLHYVMLEEKPDMTEARELIDDINYSLGKSRFITERWKAQYAERAAKMAKEASA